MILSVWTIHLPPSQHSIWSDAPFEHHPMNLHSLNTTPCWHNHASSPDLVTPHSNFWLYKMIPPASRCTLKASTHLLTSSAFLNTIPSTPTPLIYQYPDVSSYIPSTITHMLECLSGTWMMAGVWSLSQPLSVQSRWRWSLFFSETSGIHPAAAGVIKLRVIRKYRARLYIGKRLQSFEWNHGKE